MKNIGFSLLLFLICSCDFSNKKTEQSNKITNLSFPEGKLIYDDFCIQCHMANGEGVAKIYPPLANSDYLKNKREESIKAIKYGQSGEIIVNGEKYNTAMASLGLTDQEIADVMNFITNNWGNENKSLITEEEVSKIER